MAEETKLNAEKKKLLMAQCKEEYEHALKYRQKRERAWLSVDELYYGVKKKSLVTRANVHIPKMQGTIETFLAKIDDAPFIAYEAQEEGDKPKAPKMNALLRRFRNNNDWDMVDLMGKKEGALYGRVIYKKFSYVGEDKTFVDVFDIVPVHDFLIDPLAGGLFPMRDARYMGHDNIIRTKYELQDKDLYDQAAVEELARKLKGDGDADNRYRSKQMTRSSLGLSDAVLVSDDSIKLCEWYTTFEGVRYMVLMSMDMEMAVRIEVLEDLYETNEFPFATWAPFPRLTEFWTPGVGELIKEPNIIQNIIVSQILDNNAYRNYGMKAYDSTKITNPAELKPRPAGKIAVVGSPRDAILNIEFPALDNAVAAYNLVEQIYDKETGVTAAAKGMPNSKRMSATEFAGLLDQVADKFFTNNRLYKTALRRIAYLFYCGVEENMTEQTRIKILGAEGYEWHKVTGAELKANYDIIISTGAQEEQNKNMMRDRWGDYIQRNRQNQRLNQRFLDEKEAQIMGMDENEIQRLLNPELEGDWEILAEAAAENEAMLSKNIKLNETATTGHIEKHLDYLRRTRDLKPEVRKRILAHAQGEIKFALRNEELRANKMIRKQMGASAVPIDPAAVEAIEKENVDRTIPTPEGVDPAAFGQALNGQYPGGINPSGADTQSEAVRLEAIRNAPTA